jgi:hypothetical protein
LTVRTPSNYPPGVTGNEPQIVGYPDEPESGEAWVGVYVLFAAAPQEDLIGVYGSPREAILSADEHLQENPQRYWDGRTAMHKSKERVRRIPEGVNWHRRKGRSEDWDCRWEGPGHLCGFKVREHRVKIARLQPRTVSREQFEALRQVLIRDYGDSEKGATDTAYEIVTEVLGLTTQPEESP